jgi:integrase
MGGLRIGELCSLRWRDVDLTSTKLRIDDAKTDAGERVVDVWPGLLDELKLHRVDATFVGRDDFVFAKSRGTRRHRSNATRQILQPTIKRANVALANAGRLPIEGVTNHSLRRTFCSLLFQMGESPMYVMAQMGPTDPALALQMYAKVIEERRKGDDSGLSTAEKLMKGSDWALMGTGAPESDDASSAPQTKTAPERGFLQLRD